MSDASDADIHEWISFEDDDELRTWEFDATFLRSNYQCIWGCGCQGVLDEPAEELQQGCCSYGAHFVDEDDVQTVVRAFVRTSPEHMQFHAKATKGGFLRAGDGPGDDENGPPTTTRVVDGACIFLNRPGFEGGAGCALHIAAEASGERPIDWKPNVCWQLPIRVDHFTDEQGHVLSRLREWKRRDWGDGGADFAWWCTEAPEAFSGSRPLYLTARDEIVELVGEGVYDRLVELLERPDWVPLPHPVARRS
ncbi:hypothetical protein BDK89_1891 [Ilumatobacter fluminis]|uniref:DUF3109 family protein n=1 Tax=Ilumatobacter fluminis TaxID=467091 RepID=A0A4R7HYK6_9ACTN|nr:hypothetical protein [Ilumatobacter fluminis]TDT16307.1 hypothetical protein BDK89_1891 [Ilumatobacter fluminis]